MKSVDITPAQYFGLSGGYLTIEQQQLLSPLPADKSEDLFYKAGFDAFRLVAEDKTGTRGTFREPSADGVEAMRRAMRGGIVKALYDDEDFNAFLAAIKNALVGANE